MDKEINLDRRHFLRLSAITAASATIAACGRTPESSAPRGTATTAAGPAVIPTSQAAAPTAMPTVIDPTTVDEMATISPDSIGAATPPPAPRSFQEAPTLASLVKEGKLPPVEERLPRNPHVLPHEWLTPGKYGGHMRWAYSSEWGTSHFVVESMYGHSPLRWLKDGLEIGPGLVESWSSNDDASEWTLHFREGLKWSDGQPWTTADVMYWWEDMVLSDEHTEGPPDEARSGKGTLMTLSAPDDTTIVMQFDAPAPLTADRLANFVNRGIGPQWMIPRHYMEQFHPKYNPEHEDFTLHDEKMDYAINPECPVMTGWRLKSYRESVNSVWERNPYYWCVDKEGNQLPFIDTLTNSNVANLEVLKLNYQQGRADFVNGAWGAAGLEDVAALRQSQNRHKMEIDFWDSGDGTGSMFFFNHDYFQDKMRELIRNPKFRQALSHGFDRKEVQKVVYFNTGELTTGTLSTKAIEYNVNEQGKKVYQQWRDSYVKYDPEKAKSMLDEIGVVDKDGDGMREMPDGSKLKITLDYGAPGSHEHLRKNELLARDWKAIGINTQLNPLPPEAEADRWLAGRQLTKTAWSVGDGPNHLVYPHWLVPIGNERWAPLQGTFYSVRGTPQETAEQDKDPYKRTPPRMEPEEGGPVDRLWKLYDQSKVETDTMRRHQLVWDMIKIHIEDGPFFLGTVANFPRVMLIKEGLENVPRRDDFPTGGYNGPWILPIPAIIDPESWYWENPEAHT